MLSERQQKRIERGNYVRDSLFKGGEVTFYQEVAGHRFKISVKMETVAAGEPERNKAAAEEMAEYIVYGGMAL